MLNVASIAWTLGLEFYVPQMDQELEEALEEIREVFWTMYPKVPWNGRIRARRRSQGLA